MLFMGQRKNRSDPKTGPVSIGFIKCMLSRYNTPVIAFTYRINKTLGGHGSRMEQQRLIVDPERTGSIDEVLARLERMVIPLNSCTTFATQGVIIVEYKGDLHHRVKVGVCHTIGGKQTSENGVDVSRAVDIDVASEGTTGSHMGQQRLIVDSKGTGSIDEVLARLERMATPLNSCATFATQGVIIVEYKGDLHHRVKIGVCHTIGGKQTSENGVGVSRAVNVDVASEGTAEHSD